MFRWSGRPALLSGVAYVGTGSIRDFKGSYWLKASPVIPISPTDAPGMGEDGKLTLEVVMDEAKSSKFVRVVVSSRPVKVGDRY